MKQFQRILVSIDSKADPGPTIERAIQLAKASGASLRLVDVVPKLPVYLQVPQYGYPALSETLKAEYSERLARTAAWVRSSGVEVDSKALYGRPDAEISGEALAGGFDLVMVAGDDSPEDGVRRPSDAMNLFRICPTPVWAVRPGEATPYRRIVAAVDPLSHAESAPAMNRRIVETAMSMAQLEGGRVDVLHVYGEGLAGVAQLAGFESEIRKQAEAALAGLVADSADRLPPDHQQLVKGEPAGAIADFVAANDVDLLVMGTAGRTGIAGLLIGNTAEQTLSSVACSVLAIKPDGFRSPVEDD